MRLGLRTRLLIVSSVLLALPWLGLRAAREIETFLVETQEQGLASTARAVATALNERPAVFVTEGGPGATSGGGADRPTLRIETLSRPIVLDGDDADWRDQRPVSETHFGQSGGRADLPGTENHVGRVGHVPECCNGARICRA